MTLKGYLSGLMVYVFAGIVFYISGIVTISYFVIKQPGKGYEKKSAKNNKPVLNFNLFKIHK